MSAAEQPLETEHRPREWSRLQAQGRRTGDNSERTLLVINKADGPWSIHGLGAPRVRLPRDVMVTLAESTLRRAR